MIALLCRPFPAGSFGHASPRRAANPVTNAHCTRNWEVGIWSLIRHAKCANSTLAKIPPRLGTRNSFRTSVLKSNVIFPIERHGGEEFMGQALRHISSPFPGSLVSRSTAHSSLKHRMTETPMSGLIPVKSRVRALVLHP